MDQNISARKLDWDEIPVIDLAPWFHGNAEEQKKVADEVVSACCTSGFFYIVNHQVPLQLLTSVFGVARDFFALPIEGAFNVNIGEMLTRWTNGRFKATPHRVVNTSGQTRYSVPFFFVTNYDVNIKPLDVCVPEGTIPIYEEILAGEYLVSRLNEIYG